MAISIHKETETAIRAYGKKKELEASDALDKLVKSALNHAAALARFLKKPKDPKTGRVLKSVRSDAKRAKKAA